MASLDALRDYVYGKSHADVLRRRLKWFDRPTQAHLALWWIEAGSIPTLADAEGRLLKLRLEGPSPDVFTLKETYPATARASARPPAPAP